MLFAGTGNGYRYVLTAVLCSFSLFFLASTANADVNVNVRIETPTETVFNGPVSTGERALISEDLSPGTINFCDSNEPAGPPDWSTPTVPSGGPTANSAVHDAAALMGMTYGTSGSRYLGSFGIAMCRIGSHGSIDNVQTWSVKINDQGHPNGGFVTGDTVLSEGDDVLWYLGGPNITRTTNVKLPATVPAQGTVSGRVSVFKNSDDSKVSTVIGAKVEGGGASANVRTDGSFNLVFPEEGTFLVSATAPNAARSSTFVTVGPPLTQAQKASLVKSRLARCRAKYRSKKRASAAAKRRNLRQYRRCVKVVKSKYALGI